jgi:hypothetical protein
VHPEHKACAAFVELTNTEIGGALLYAGETPGSIMNKAFEEEMRPTKRQAIPPQVREELQASQQGLCVECGDERVDDYEVDHRIPLRFGGGNDFTNLAAVCCHCHASKTSHENQICHLEDRNPLLSRFNRETYEAFVLSPKPPPSVQFTPAKGRRGHDPHRRNSLSNVAVS